MSLSNLKRRFAIDTVKSEAGTVVDLGDGIKVTIAKWLNPKHDKSLTALREPFKALLEAGGTVPPSDWARINNRSIAEAILIGWEGVTDETGAAIPYSVDAAYELLADDELVTFRNLVIAKSQEQQRFLKYAAEAAEGNSEGSPAGTGSGASS